MAGSVSPSIIASIALFTMLVVSSAAALASKKHRPVIERRGEKNILGMDECEFMPIERPEADA